MKISQLVLIGFSLAIPLANGFAQDNSSPSKSSSKNKTDSGSFRCEKMRGATLGEFKAKMLENCNLDKPFSMSTSESISGKETYTFCCHSN